MNYIEIFQNKEASSVSVGNYYLEYQQVHKFLDKFHQGENYSDQIASHQAELRRKQKSTDQKYLSISSLRTDYLNIDSRSGLGRNSESANTNYIKCTFCAGTNHFAEKCFRTIRQEK